MTWFRSCVARTRQRRSLMLYQLRQPVPIWIRIYINRFISRLRISQCELIVGSQLALFVSWGFDEFVGYQLTFNDLSEVKMSSDWAHHMSSYCGKFVTSWCDLTLGSQLALFVISQFEQLVSYKLTYIDWGGVKMSSEEAHNMSSQFEKPLTSYF